MVLLFDRGNEFFLLFFSLVDQHFMLLVLQVVDIFSEFVLVEVVVGGVGSAASGGAFLGDLPLLNLDPLERLVQLVLLEEVPPVPTHQLETPARRVLEVGSTQSVL